MALQGFSVRLMKDCMARLAKMKLSLAINTGFLVNRFSTPEKWIPFLADDIGIKRVQFTASLLNIYMPRELCLKIARKTKKIANRYGVLIESTFTDAYTRLNHFSHPDLSVRRWWLDVFKQFVDISVTMGAKSMGSHLGILTMPDWVNPRIRMKRFEETVVLWRKLADYAKKAGLEFLTWEPMSIGREYGETISEIRRIQTALGQNFSIPMLLCLDVDHGDIGSENTEDANPYAYLRAFGHLAPQIHLKQSLQDKKGHWPFTPEYNAKGRIIPEKVIQSIAGLREDVSLILELSFRERSTAEAQIVSDVKQSIKFWRHFCSA